MKMPYRNRGKNNRRLYGSQPYYDKGFDMPVSNEDSALLEKISDYLKACSDIEDIKNDPFFEHADMIAKKSIADQKGGNKLNEKYIKDNITVGLTEEQVNKEIIQIKKEIKKNNLNEITRRWIRDWQDKKKNTGERDPETEKIREFITNSLREPAGKSEVNQGTVEKKSSGIILIARYASLVAAAVVGAVLVIRILLLQDDPDKIFSKYYEPLNAISNVTRGYDIIENASFTAAIESYKIGDYESAASGFTVAMSLDSISLSPRFFQGITQLALENYDKAIPLLDGVAAGQDDFSKEARWYLGLSYLKTGNKSKASECFETLAQNKGFYMERSEKILRRLK